VRKKLLLQKLAMRVGGHLHGLEGEVALFLRNQNDGAKSSYLKCIATKEDEQYEPGIRPGQGHE
jgi:hypothetical protein